MPDCGNFCGGRLLAEPVVLMLGDDSIIEINQHLRSEQAIQVPDGVLGEDSGIWQAELVGVIEILRHNRGRCGCAHGAGR